MWWSTSAATGYCWPRRRSTPAIQKGRGRFWQSAGHATSSGRSGSGEPAQGSRRGCSGTWSLCRRGFAVRDRCPCGRAIPAVQRERDTRRNTDRRCMAPGAEGDSSVACRIRPLQSWARRKWESPPDIRELHRWRSSASPCFGGTPEKRRIAAGSVPTARRIRAAGLASFLRQRSVAGPEGSTETCEGNRAPSPGEARGRGMGRQRARPSRSYRERLSRRETWIEWRWKAVHRLRECAGACSNLAVRGGSHTSTGVLLPGSSQTWLCIYTYGCFIS